MLELETMLLMLRASMYFVLASTELIMVQEPMFRTGNSAISCHSSVEVDFDY